jgi:hypothetical protein
MLMMTRWASVSLAINLALLVSFWMDTTFGVLGMTHATQIARPERQSPVSEVIEVGLVEPFECVGLVWLNAHVVLNHQRCKALAID